MKKIFLFLMILSIILITGCGKNSCESIFKDLTNKISKLNNYTLNGILEVKNNNNSYTYDVVVSYAKKDKFRVSLVNTSNSHEQVILRNDDGVFVLTPSLNKSFKFQSDWPYNNSQVYLLGSIIDDLNKDSNVTKEEKDGKYIFTSKVSYPNNNKLVSQKVTVANDLSIEKVEILNDDGKAEMIFTVKSIDYNPTFDETYFEVNSIINTNKNKENTDNSDNKEANNNSNSNSSNNSESDNNSNANDNNSNNTNNTNQSNNITPKKTSATMNGDLEDKLATTNITETATLDDIIYPLYLPTGTVLKEQEKVSKTDGERVILTFAGDKSFTLVEETVAREKEFTIIPTYGEPGFVLDTIGAITDNSLNWVSGNVEYYMVSDVMNAKELLDIANSINVTAVSALK